MYASSHVYIQYTHIHIYTYRHIDIYTYNQQRYEEADQKTFGKYIA